MKHFDPDHAHQLRSEEEDTPSRIGRRRRRGIVMTMRTRKSYWSVLDWLSQGTRHPRFWTFGEAVEHYRNQMFGPGMVPNDHARAGYVVARFFAMQGQEWLL